MKKYTKALLAPLSVLAIYACAPGQYNQSQEYDDIYFTSSDRPSAPKVVESNVPLTTEQASAKEVPNKKTYSLEEYSPTYVDEELINKYNNEGSNPDDDAIDLETVSNEPPTVLDYYDTYDNEGYYNTPVVNNYYFNGGGFYDPFYTYSYNYDPFLWGDPFYNDFYRFRRFRRAGWGLSLGVSFGSLGFFYGRPYSSIYSWGSPFYDPWFSVYDPWCPPYSIISYNRFNTRYYAGNYGEFGVRSREVVRGPRATRSTIASVRSDANNGNVASPGSRASGYRQSRASANNESATTTRSNAYRATGERSRVSRGRVSASGTRSANSRSAVTRSGNVRSSDYRFDRGRSSRNSSSDIRNRSRSSRSDTYRSSNRNNSFSRSSGSSRNDTFRRSTSGNRSSGVRRSSSGNRSNSYSRSNRSGRSSGSAVRRSSGSNRSSGSSVRRSSSSNNRSSSSSRSGSKSSSSRSSRGGRGN